MSRFSVVPSELRQAAEVVRDSIVDFTDQSLQSYWLDPSNLEDTELAGALTEFQSRSTAAITVLLDDGGEMASRLGDTSVNYDETDIGVARSFTEILGR